MSRTFPFLQGQALRHMISTSIRGEARIRDDRRLATREQAAKRPGLAGTYENIEEEVAAEGTRALLESQSRSAIYIYVSRRTTRVLARIGGIQGRDAY